VSVVVIRCLPQPIDGDGDLLGRDVDSNGSPGLTVNRRTLAERPPDTNVKRSTLTKRAAD
jgi:hypothetical protein